MPEHIDGQTPYTRLCLLAGFTVKPCEHCGSDAHMPSLRKLAARVGVEFHAVNRIRRYEDVSLHSIRAIAAGLGMTPGQVVDALWPEPTTTIQTGDTTP